MASRWRRRRPPFGRHSTKIHPKRRHCCCPQQVSSFIVLACALLGYKLSTGPSRVSTVSARHIELRKGRAAGPLQRVIKRWSSWSQRDWADGGCWPAILLPGPCDDNSDTCRWNVPLDSIRRRGTGQAWRVNSWEVHPRFLYVVHWFPMVPKTMLTYRAIESMTQTLIKLRP